MESIVIGEDFQLPVDASGFSRRTCPRCGVDFKVRWSHRDGRVLATAFAHRLEHLNAGEAPPAGSPRHCPYCAATGAAETFWTEAERQWFEAKAHDVTDELRWRRLRLPLDRLGDNPRPTYVTVAPDRSSVPPEPDDESDSLIDLPLPCCGEEMKVSESWTGPLRCHFCGFVHARTITRDIGLELAQLWDWGAEP